MIDFTKLKKIFLYSLIGALIVSAIVAVITILIGTFNETAARVFFTLFSVIMHSFLGLSFIWSEDKQERLRSLAFFANILFLIIVASFITSILNIWDIIQIEMVWNLYQTYFIVGFASLHLTFLTKALNKEKLLNSIVYVNYAFIGIVAFMLLPIVYVSNAFEVLGELYYRILGATAIIDGTLSILAIILYKLYLNKHPEEQITSTKKGQKNKIQKRGFSIWIWILLAYIAFQIIFPLILLISGRLL